MENRAAASIKLNGYAGKTFRILNGNLYTQRAFCYAYIDLNTECSSAFVALPIAPMTLSSMLRFLTVTRIYLVGRCHLYHGTGNTQTINLPPLFSRTVIAVVG